MQEMGQAPPLPLTAPKLTKPHSLSNHKGGGSASRTDSPASLPAPCPQPILLRSPAKKLNQPRACSATTRIYHQPAGIKKMRPQALACKRTFLPSRDSGGIQTHNLLIRSQMLYSVKLRSLLFQTYILPITPIVKLLPPWLPHSPFAA